MKLLALCIGACLLFCAGFAIRGDDSLMQRLGIEPSADGAALSPGAASQASGELSSRLAEVESILSAESLDSYDVGIATSAVLDSFLASTDDAFTRYFNDARYTSYVNVAAQDYPGIGVFFAEYEGRAYALDVFEGSSAAESGVASGDFVVAIDGDRSQAWSAAEVANAVQREAGSDVVITWQRPSDSDASAAEEFTTTLECADYSEANVTTELVGNVGYISLSQFTQNADALVRQAIETLADGGAASFVLDLRDNPGGYLSKAVDVASLFVKSGVVVQIETVEASTVKQASGDVATDAPLVALVNENTAGAAEVLAAALRDTGRATLVGATTMGKGSVQVTQPLSFGGAIRYTAARYKSAAGYAIDRVGIAPDVSVAEEDGGDADAQREYAIGTAASLSRS